MSTTSATRDPRPCPKATPASLVTGNATVDTVPDDNLLKRAAETNNVQEPAKKPKSNYSVST